MQPGVVGLQKLSRVSWRCGVTWRLFGIFKCFLPSLLQTQFDSGLLWRVFPIFHFWINKLFYVSKSFLPTLFFFHISCLDKLLSRGKKMYQNLLFFSIINFFNIYLLEVLKVRGSDQTHLYSNCVTDWLVWLLSVSTAWMALAIVQMPS